MKVKSEARWAAILETATDPFIKAKQFLSLITTETNTRLLERDPPPLSIEQIRPIVLRAVEMFLAGAAPR
jgi:hypothetical protein